MAMSREERLRKKRILNALYWRKNKARRQEYFRQHYLNNKEKKNAAAKAYYRRTRELRRPLDLAFSRKYNDENKLAKKICRELGMTMDQARAKIKAEIRDAVLV